MTKLREISKSGGGAAAARIAKDKPQKDHIGDGDGVDAEEGNDDDDDSDDEDDEYTTVQRSMFAMFR